MIFIDIEHIIISSEGKKQLKIQAEIQEHSLTGISGLSGAGKTTLLRMIAGLTKPDKGLIKLNNSIVFDSLHNIHIPPQKRNIGFMFQDYALFPNMSVEENISFAQGNCKDSELIQQLLETFGLKNLRRQKPHQLSGGQKQRTALARSLSGKPDILLLDEPLSAVDEEMRHRLQEKIITAHKLFKSTTLLVSHNNEELERMADRILVIE